MPALFPLCRRGQGQHGLRQLLAHGPAGHRPLRGQHQVWTRQQQQQPQTLNSCDSRNSSTLLPAPPPTSPPSSPLSAGHRIEPDGQRPVVVVHGLACDQSLHPKCSLTAEDKKNAPPGLMYAIDILDLTRVGGGPAWGETGATSKGLWGNILLSFSFSDGLKWVCLFPGCRARWASAPTPTTSSSVSRPALTTGPPRAFWVRACKG